MMSILETRLAMLANGYPLIPVAGKIPPFKEWQKIENVSRALLEEWDRDWPHASNTGIPTRLVPTLDLDLLNEPAAIAAEKLVRERLEGKGRILSRVGRAPKRAIPFRTKAPFKKITTIFAGGDRIEFLGDGQQFVAHGVHPDTLKDYLWGDGDPTSVKYDDLPEILDGTGAKQLHDDIVEMLVRDFGYAIAKDHSAQANGGAPPRRATGAPKNPKRDQAWAQAALERECAAIANTPCGQRNATLNLGAWNIFQIVWGNPGLLDEEEVRARLFAAAETCGLVADDGADSVWKTIASGAEGARAHPRVRPPALLEQPAAAGSGGGGGLLGTGPGPGAGAAPGASPAPGTRRIIPLIEGERHRIVDEAEEALVAAGGFDVYQRDAVMVRPVMHRLPAATRHGLKRTTASWRLMPVKPYYLIEMLGRVARFTKYDGRRKDWVDKDCPKEIGDTLMAREGAWNVPVLFGVVHNLNYAQMARY
jgi:hypothetical protein